MAELDSAYEKAIAQIREVGCDPADPLTTPLDKAREAQDRYFAFRAQDSPAVAAVRDFRLDGPAGPFKTRIYYPATAQPLPVIVFVRDAGWWAGSLDSHDVGRVPETAQKIAQKFGQEMVDKLEKEGWRFTLDANAPPEAFQR